MSTTLPNDCIVDQNGGSFSVTFTATKEWSIDTSDDWWLRVDNSYGSAGENTVVFEYKACDEPGMIRSNGFVIYCYSGNGAEGYETDKLYCCSIFQEAGSIVVRDKEDFNDDGTISILATESEFNIDVAASRMWSASIDQDWLSLDMVEEGYIFEPGYTYLRFKPTKNNTDDERKATISFSCEETGETVEVVVIQSVSTITIIEDEYVLDNLAGSEIHIPFSVPDGYYMAYSSEEDVFDIRVDYVDGSQVIIIKTLSENKNAQSRYSHFTLGYETDSQTVNLAQKGRGVVLMDDDTLFLGYNDASNIY